MALARLFVAFEIGEGAGAVAVLRGCLPLALLEIREFCSRALLVDGDSSGDVAVYLLHILLRIVPIDLLVVDRIYQVLGNTRQNESGRVLSH